MQSEPSLQLAVGGLKPSTVQVMAPEPPYAKTHRPQLAALGLIALDVPRQFWLPIGLISVRDSSVLWALMEETAIEGQRQPRNEYVRLPR